MKATYLIKPDTEDPSLTRSTEAVNYKGERQTLQAVVEKPLTLFLNSQEIVTLMTIRDHPIWLAVGFLLNQNMLLGDDELTAAEYDDELETVVIRTKRKTDYEKKLKKKTQTSGCSVGTAFGDLMERFDEINLPTDKKFKVSWLYELLKIINTTDSLYLKAGAIHGCVLCHERRPLIFMEDVGRHNAVDKIAGYMFYEKIDGGDKSFYTTGRLTSEMVIKTVQMGLAVLISRSGFTAWGIELAKQAGLTMIGRARGKRFEVLSDGPARIQFDD